MISPGIYIRKKLDFIVEELSRKLEGFTLVENTGIPQSGINVSSDRITVHISEREDGWCHIEVAGDVKGTSALTDFLTVHRNFGDVLVWNCDDRMSKYNYTLLEEGKVLEQFSVMGAAVDSVSYVSELRNVQLQDLIDGRNFALEALRRFSICPEGESKTLSREVNLEFTLPPKRSFWQSLFGSLSGRE